MGKLNNINLEYPLNLMFDIETSSTFTEDQRRNTFYKLMEKYNSRDKLDELTVTLDFNLLYFSERQRYIISAYYKDNKTYTSIAKTIGVSSANIPALIDTVIKKLRRCPSIQNGIKMWLDESLQNEYQKGYRSGQYNGFIDGEIRGRAVGVSEKEFLDFIILEESDLSVRAFNILKRKGAGTLFDAETLYNTGALSSGISKKVLDEITDRLSYFKKIWRKENESVAKNIQKVKKQGKEAYLPVPRRSGADYEGKI